MTPKSKARKLTLVSVANHEFNRALRVWKSTIPPLDIFRSLVRERGRVLGFGLRALGVAVVLMLWLTANRPELALRIMFIDLEVPVSYVNFVMGACLYAAMLNVISYFVFNEFIRVASNKLFRFDASWTLVLLDDGGSAWSGGMLRQFRFLSSKEAHRVFGPIVGALISAPFLIVLGALYWTTIRVGLRVISTNGFIGIDAVLTIVVWLLAVFPIIYIILLFTRFRFEKNTTFIRWNFLYPLYRRGGLTPPRVDHWLKTDS